MSCALSSFSRWFPFAVFNRIDEVGVVDALMLPHILALEMMWCNDSINKYKISTRFSQRNHFMHTVHVPCHTNKNKKPANKKKNNKHAKVNGPKGGKVEAGEGRKLQLKEKTQRNSPVSLGLRTLCISINLSALKPKTHS